MENEALSNPFKMITILDRIQLQHFIPHSITVWNPHKVFLSSVEKNKGSAPHHDQLLQIKSLMLIDISFVYW
jgi:hypothetical protein